MFTTIDKAITAVLVPGIVQGIIGALNGAGIDSKMTVGTLVTMLVTGFFVWLFPNKKA